jgi:hypothetical protein
MTFREIEKVTGTKLPNSKQYPAWWSNNTWNNVMTKVWLDAGYRTEQVDVAHERLVFRRVGRSAMQEGARTYQHKDASEGHPGWGLLKGTFTIELGWDPAKSPLDGEELDIDRTADLIDRGLGGSK